MRRILIVDDHLPVPMRGYGFPRGRAILFSLIELGYRVEFLPLQTARRNSRMAALQIVDKDRYLAGLPELTIWLNPTKAFASISPNDIIWISRLNNLAWVKEYFSDVLRKNHWIFDIEALVAPREALRRRNLGEKFDLAHAQDLEASILADAPVKVAASPLDQQRLLARGVNDVQILGHPIMLTPTPRRYSDRTGLLFVGSFFEIDRLSPNRDAVHFLLDRIWPRLSDRLGCTLTVAGYGAARLREYGLPASDGVQLVENVKSVFELYDANRVVVAPTRYASGIPWKVHEALGHGIPIILSDVLAEQLTAEGAEDGRCFLSGSIASPPSLSEAIAYCYNTPQLWQKLRVGGLAYVQQTCSPEKFRSSLVRILG